MPRRAPAPSPESLSAEQAPLWVILLLSSKALSDLVVILILEFVWRILAAATGLVATAKQ